MSLLSILNPAVRKGCENFAKGDCKRGQACNFYHHYNLDPARREDEGRHDWDVPNDLGIACMRCTQQLRECDKVGRGGNDDPCSECRHFGGPRSNCRLAETLSYNDHAWGQMITRSETGFDLAPLKHREDPIRGHKNKKTNIREPDRLPVPIDNAFLKSDWRGETREQLLQKSDFLAPFVRKLPRACVVPPHIREKSIKRDTYFFTSSGSTTTPTTPPCDAIQSSSPTTAPCVASQSSFAPSLPQLDTSELLNYKYDLKRGQATWKYKSGVKITVPVGPP
ncbi:hypothetical protein A1F95_07469 [Pyrenophora tritici-repentis]|nr:hypothetical protein A1F95_07469 [Pyrenophora tritici-repentis]